MSLTTYASLDSGQGPRAHPHEHEWLLRLWEKVLNVSSVGWATRFCDCGGDSLLAVNLLLAVEKIIGRRIDPNLLQPEMTPYRLAQVLQLQPSYPQTGK